MPAGAPRVVRCGLGRRLAWALPGAVSIVLTPALARAAELSIDLGGGSTSAQIVRFVLLLTGLALLPGLLVCITSFTRIVVVLSFLRSAIGLQQAPPNMVLISLALFLTGFVMAPVLQESWQAGIQPLLEERIDEETALARAAEPLARFMLAQVRDKDLGLFFEIAGIPPPDEPQAVPYRVLVPAFVISELRRAFEIGFLVFLPFLVIDMVVASILMSMGMMMVPPQTVSLPFKLIFFVLVDGWYLLAGSLVQSFVPVP
jgi:flagellar biosynthetic protein FliP